MPNLNPLANLWSIVKEADLRPLREQAEKLVNLAIVGQPGSGREALAEALRQDPARPDFSILHAPMTLLDLDAAESAAGADLIILILAAEQVDSHREQELVRNWHNAGKQVLVFINYSPAQLPPGEAAALHTGPVKTAEETGAAHPSAQQTPAALSTQPRVMPSSDRRTPASAGRTRTRGVVRGSLGDALFMSRDFAPAVIELLPERVISLARFFPFFRVPVANYLINDTSFSNAAYAFSTALAETVGVLNVPIAMTDMVILTKNQLFLVYKLGLALGFSTRWQDYVGEFGGVLGSGFLWRQIARSLVGMVPVLGIVPKTAISYAGTYTVGNAVLQWYLTGRHLEPGQIRRLYQQALENGRSLAQRLLRRAPRRKEISAGAGTSAALEGGKPRRKPGLSLPQVRLRLPRLRRRKAALPESAGPASITKACPQCRRENAVDARFCQYCGFVYTELEPEK